MNDYGGGSLDENSIEHESSFPCYSSKLINTTLLDHGEKYGMFSWLWAHSLFLQWTPFHHISFQFSQFLLLLIFLSPSLNNTTRFLSLLYSVSIILFAYFILSSIDLVAWGSAILLTNSLYMSIKICRAGLRSHSKELEQVYRVIFEKLHISRDQFSMILSCKKSTRVLSPNSHYALEKHTRVDSLGLLLSGKLLVSQQGRPLHVILPFQFVDSPEYFGVSTDELFQVTITAVEESKILSWHRDKLRLTIMSDEFLSIMFDHIIGRDVVRKLIQVSDTVTIPSSNGIYMQSNGQKDLSGETDPMLHLENKDLNGGQFGTTSPFETNEVWSLTKIDEELTQV